MYLFIGFVAVAKFAEWAIKAYSVFYEWFSKKIGNKTKKVLEQEKNEERLKNVEEAVIEIKNTANKNVNMFLDHEKQVVGEFFNMRNDILSELNRLNGKIVEHKEETDKTDCAMLRDRIGSGMRYFSRNVGPDGKVHISWSDWENMNALFQEYFSKHGNGAFKKMYDDEFKYFVIDR